MTLLLKDEQSILFLHVPKSGGSSVVKLFQDNGYRSTIEMRGLPSQECLVSPQHQTCENLKSMIKLDKLTDIFILTRNPYTRVKSEYNWHFRNTKSWERPDINEWITEALKAASIENEYQDNHLRCSSDFVDLSSPCKIFKIEDGMEFIAEFFLQKSGSLMSIQIPHEKEGSQLRLGGSKKELNSCSIDAINHFYKKDFEAFGYQMIGDTTDPYLCGEDKISTKEKINTIKMWRKETLDLLFTNLAVKLQLFSSAVDKNNGEIYANRLEETVTPKEASKSIGQVYDNTLLNLKSNMLNLKTCIHGSQDPKEEHIRNMIKLIDEYRIQLNPAY